jgi:hypothetical protein
MIALDRQFSCLRHPAQPGTVEAFRKAPAGKQFRFAIPYVFAGNIRRWIGEAATEKGSARKVHNEN